MGDPVGPGHLVEHLPLRSWLPDSTARSLPGGLAAATSVWAGDLSALTAASIASLGDPKTIREVWNALRPAQREKLTSADPLVIGNLDGIPLRDRVTANRISIQNEIARRRSEVDDLQKQIDPTSSAIGSYYGPIDPQTGDIPAWVKHTAVSVPGTGANMADFSESRAQDLYLASGYDSAVFQWAGGAFPQTIPEATQASYSEKLAPRLASFVDSVNVSSGPNTAHVPHYSMMARHDAVVGLIQGNNGDWNAIHGQSPLNAPSVTRLETGFVDASDHGKGDMESTGVIDSHSKVFTRGSTSFDNMVAVITGSQAELFAPDDLVNTYSGAGPVFIDGVDSPDYSPHYIEVK
ncbi:hypothetical protein [Microbacterium laevaniformans]|uniref:hypothetical protein n=1 Tax=Microbacterium laevaniformans TaxID=36807 RepID=UPI001E4E1FF8|nr:hypothetical protein [Microbacterium laevaniformans]